MNPGVIGGIIGGVIGVLGGLMGTYFSIKNVKGPQERAFMIKCAVWAWIGIAVFLALLFYLPKPYNFLLWIPYAIVLPRAIIYGNRKQREIREKEKGSQKDG